LGWIGLGWFVVLVGRVGFELGLGWVKTNTRIPNGKAKANAAKMLPIPVTKSTKTSQQQKMPLSKHRH